MSRRALVSVRAVAMVVAVVALGAMPAVAQDGVPRTAWGHSDLQGIWDFRSITPLERPEVLGDRAFLSEEEAAELEHAVVDRNARLLTRSPSRRRPAATCTGGRTGHWGPTTISGWTWEPASLARGVPRWIIDPPNGRLPALTANGQRRAETRRQYVQQGHPRCFMVGSRCRGSLPAGDQRRSTHHAELLQPKPAGVSDPGPRRAAYRNGSHRSCRPSRWASSPERQLPSVVGGCTRPLGRGYFGCRDLELRR